MFERFTRSETAYLLHRPFTDHWECVDPSPTPGLPPRMLRRTVAGGWRRDGKPMQGVYTQPTPAPDPADTSPWLIGGAFVNGWCSTLWRGPAALADWTSPLVSCWNWVERLGSCRFGLVSHLDPDGYGVDAVLGGWKATTHQMLCSRRQVRRYREQAYGSPTRVRIDVTQFGRRRVLSVARIERIDELFPDLGGLVDLYERVLPAEFAGQIDALANAYRRVPLDFVSEVGDRSELVWDLLAGIPPLVTAGYLIGWFHREQEVQAEVASPVLRLP